MRAAIQVSVAQRGSGLLERMYSTADHFPVLRRVFYCAMHAFSADV